MVTWSIRSRSVGQSRLRLLGSAAAFVVAIGASQAQAEVIDQPKVNPLAGASISLAPIAALSDEGKIDPISVVRESQGSDAFIDPVQAVLESQTRRTDTAVISPVQPDPEILIANPGTPTTARDPVNITGIGQMIVNQGGGFIGLCTGTLINPRTVIFAAHCVNSAPATSYGANSGGTAIGFGFETNLRANGAGQVDELVRWLFGGAGGAGQFQTNIAQSFYNANYVAYNPLSLEPNAAGFLYGDIAIAGLDTPAANIPTWALLFSPLPAPGTIDANGTGYHVNIVGYGNNGTGQSGAGGIDFRRRAAENILGGLLSLGDFEQFLFGPTGTTNTTNPYNLYWLDFDDPRRGTPGASPYDFNAFRDNALPNEGITSQGDSGGPLILDRTYARQLVIGVLSGGYTRFFGGQPANGYGTASFYQPLYLYWDWIAANNPYRYVGAVAGDGNWTDPTHWVTNNDPNYFIIGPNNTLVNGVPSAVLDPATNTSGKFGQICFQNSQVSDCLDISTGVETITGGPIGTAGNGRGVVDIDQVIDGSALVSSESIGGETPVADPQAVTSPAIVQAGLPAATIANGLPGATNFVPNNLAGDRVNGVAPRYFDVTLAANGTTTLNTAVTIDRLTLNGVGARLNIAAGGSLTSLINVTQMTGTMQVNGSLTSVGDYLFVTGGLNGTGTITAPFFTSVLGVISPGASGSAGSVGTLTFRGNVILSSGNTYNVDLGANGTSDRIAVQATSFDQANAPLNGQANIGGNLALGYSASTLRAGNVYTILTSQGARTGTFQAPTAISAILTPTLTYTSNAVQLTVTAGQYRNVVSSGSRVQLAYANLLDQNRALQASLDSIYGPLDLQNQATIRAQLDALAPRTEALVNSLGIASVDNLGRFYRERLANLDTSGGLGGTIAVIGRPLEIAAASAAGVSGIDPVAADASEARVEEGRLPEDFRAYLAGGYVDGSSRPMSTALPVAGRDQFNGFYIAGGLEKQLGDTGAVGASFAYSDLKGKTGVVGQTANAQLYQGTLYGKVDLSKGIKLDGQLSAGIFDNQSIRNVGFVGTPYSLRANDHSLVFASEVGLSGTLQAGIVKIDPRASIRYSYIDFSDIAETGGGPALRYERNQLHSLQARIGFAATTTSTFRPYLSGYFVRETENRGRNSELANFVGGTGPGQAFALFSTDNNWGEISGGLTYAGDRMSLSVGADTTIFRDDVRNQSYKASVAIKF